MARKKIDSTTEVSQVDTQDTLEPQSNLDMQNMTEAINMQVDTVDTVEQSSGDVPNNTDNSEVNLDNKTNHEKQITPAILPEHILKVLQTFSDIPKMYINDAGRVFTAGSKPSLVGNAILYKNPFYKSKK